jgi:hypothetical protein
MMIAPQVSARFEVKMAYAARFSHLSSIFYWAF